eukprot:234428-Amphidinium_carterae.1
MSGNTQAYPTCADASPDVQTVCVAEHRAAWTMASATRRTPTSSKPVDLRAQNNDRGVGSWLPAS